MVTNADDWDSHRFQHLQRTAPRMERGQKRKVKINGWPWCGITEPCSICMEHGSAYQGTRHLYTVVYHHRNGLSAGCASPFPLLNCTHKEADHRMMFHVQSLVRTYIDDAHPVTALCALVIHISQLERPQRALACPQNMSEKININITPRYLHSAGRQAHKVSSRTPCIDWVLYNQQDINKISLLIFKIFKLSITKIFSLCPPPPPPPKYCLSELFEHLRKSVVTVQKIQLCRK